ncbi:hypothetical protein EUAN_09270 [Andreesenia angusta]|uniref:DUF3793 family protein n=1 Tax=Andreesenia angusta TaxID=39480 RepID=A0A1S1V786_9FIRM|nr:DUF3793 family protein [Andreesenia angusta]OHW62364.1 hypothetical protein EUAN_09270 [Andreesenia angusta]
MRSITEEFFKNISRLERGEYMDCFLTYMTSPVIMKLKPSMTISVQSSEIKLFREWAEKLDNQDIKHVEIKSGYEKTVVFIYSEETLTFQLESVENKKILGSLGYTSESSLEEKLERLKLRMTMDEFPHEIGVFLGIPARDVVGFIKGEECIHCGYWKVYGNLSEAKKTFGLYDLSKNIVMESILGGKNLDDTLSIMRSFRGKECSLQ